MTHSQAIRTTVEGLDRDETVQVLEAGRDWAVAILNAGGLSRAERRYWTDAKAAYESFLSE